VTAHAAPAASRTRQCITRLLRGRALRIAITTALLALVPGPAAAQVGIVASIFSDDRFRGYSLSDGRPVGILDLSYDAPNGLYGALSGSLVASRHDGVQPLRFAVNGGYAKRLRSGLTVDIGAVYSRYSEYSGVATGRSYTEIYAGLAGKFVGGRVSFSPNYIGAAHRTLHGEINGHYDLSQSWFLDGEIGLLVPLSKRLYHATSRVGLDARAGIAKRLGRITLHAAITTRTKGSDIYAGNEHGRTALVVGISSSL
jgi:uncharacterized protein (TIGR02001 family)